MRKRSHRPKLEGILTEALKMLSHIDGQVGDIFWLNQIATLSEFFYR
jgi:hypothetical protein